MKYFFELLLQVIILFIVCLGVVFLLAYSLEKHQCTSYSDVTSMPTKYAWLDGCYVGTTSGWQRWDEYKMRAITNEMR